MDGTFPELANEEAAAKVRRVLKPKEADGDPETHPSSPPLSTLVARHAIPTPTAAQSPPPHTAMSAAPILPRPPLPFPGDLFSASRIGGPLPPPSSGSSVPQPPRQILQPPPRMLGNPEIRSLLNTRTPEARPQPQLQQQPSPSPQLQSTPFMGHLFGVIPTTEQSPPPAAVPPPPPPQPSVSFLPATHLRPLIPAAELEPHKSYLTQLGVFVHAGADLRDLLGLDPAWLFNVSIFDLLVEEDHIRFIKLRKEVTSLPGRVWKEMLTFSVVSQGRIRLEHLQLEMSQKPLKGDLPAILSCTFSQPDGGLLALSMAAKWPQARMQPDGLHQLLGATSPGWASSKS